MVARVPFGPVGLALAISDSGEVTLAVWPSSGGLEVVTRSATGAVQRRQWIVEPPVVRFGARIAVEGGGAELVAWDAASNSASAGAPVMLGAAWRERGAARFGRSLRVGSVIDSPQVPQPLFVASDRAAIGLTTVAADAVPGTVSTRVQVALEKVGRPFGSPVVLSGAAARQVIAAASFAPDRTGGVFAAWTRFATSSPPTGGSLWAAHLTSRGQPQPPHKLAAGATIRLAGVAAASRDRSLVIWDLGGHGIYGADLSPGRALVFANHATDRQGVTPTKRDAVRGG
jgi:hypothetical protein